jgi:hypothetical protein
MFPVFIVQRHVAEETTSEIPRAETLPSVNALSARTSLTRMAARANHGLADLECLGFRPRRRS